MVNNEKGGTENPRIELPLNINEIHEKLELLVEKTEKIENSQKRKFDEFAEKFQSMEKSVAKIPRKNDDDENKILSTNRSKEKPKSAKQFVLKKVFENFTDLEEGAVKKSKREQHFNAKWFMQVKRNESHLEFHVFCNPIASVEDEWSIETKVEFRMIGNDDNSVIRTFKCCFDDEAGWGYDYFVKWEDIEADYLSDDKLTAQVIVEILKMTGFGKNTIRNFDESVKECSDVVLVVNDRKFYLCKMFLALQSSYFKTLLLGNFEESQKNEIELKDIDPADFQNFLELIHGESSIDDDTVSGILHLADMYDAPTAIRRCEEFLLKNSQKSMVQKLQLALRCNLESLKTKCLSEITEISDVKSIMFANLPEMDLLTSQALLQMCIDFSDK